MRPRRPHKANKIAWKKPRPLKRSPEDRDRVLSPEELHAKVKEKLDQALGADGLMVAIWRLEDGMIRLWRKAQTFPLRDFDGALDTLQENLEEEKEAKDFRRD